MAPKPQLSFVDTDTFAQNIARFATALSALDAGAGSVLAESLNDLTAETADKTVLLNNLFAAIDVQNSALGGGGVSPTVAPPISLLAVAPDSPQAPVGWFLVGLEIEGFRGINNEGDPLKITFKSDCISSVSAPNGVGKSSIYDALCFAIKGEIPKLDRLLHSERPQEYYLNRFHPGGVGTIKLTLLPDNGGPPVAIIVTRTAAGTRSVSGPAGVDAEAVLAELNREFVLLDANTFQSFIDYKALERGRAFAGLLGLAQFSTLRIQLQGLSNTRAFNSHFEKAANDAAKKVAERNVATAKTTISKEYAGLVKEPLAADASTQDAQSRCHTAINNISLLMSHCTGKAFMDVDIDACVGTIQTTENGTLRQKLAKFIQDEARWSAANKSLPSAADFRALSDLCTSREDALKETSGDVLRQLYSLSKQVLEDAEWPSPKLCPTCGKEHEHSVLDEVAAKLSQYEAVEAATSAVAAEWTARGWGDLIELEALTIGADEQPHLRLFLPSGQKGTILTAEVESLAVHIALLRQRAAEKLAELALDRAALEKELPPSLVAVTADIETARRLQAGWKSLADAETVLQIENYRMGLLGKLKAFLDQASTIYSSAESQLASDRLRQVEPVCQELFKHIMYSPVVPALLKAAGSEELGIQLSEFWGLRDVSAQALLSESYRNGFAVSVYLAAASLYGGAPRFVVLDDVTSSFDAGHQHHLVEVIRNQFARPAQANGPQVILLSHDTMLEKLFNKHSASPQWSHHRLEGTADTAVLLQAGAVNKVRDRTNELLRSGRVEEAAPRIRMYLEYILHSVIDRCRIPVPLDLAFGDDKRTSGEYLKAIEEAVRLEGKAKTLVLTPSQVASLKLHSTTITSNYLSHWSTGQVGAYSGPALMGVMQAITDFPDCFKHEPTPGEPKKFYASLSRR